MKAVTYITENTIMKFLYNPKKTFLEGFVKDEMQSHDKSFSWFHQCGSGQEQNGNYYGYQFFEVCSKTEESDAKRMAEIIAEKIGTNVV